ncbi:MAG: GntR family transcriptional regulator [Lachnospiraceae bacterium]|nr:GntR family transcriptional regulator [Lachnospiraceae bacterium]
MGEYDVNYEASDKYSLGSRVFYKLREDILNGKYNENDELREAAVGEELGVSRTPVREAFRQLELEGLIRIVPNKGAYVTGISSSDVADIYEIRSLLEGLCARWATKKITKDAIEEMEETILLSEFHLKKGHYDQLTELDNRFHMQLYEACESKMLIHLLKDFHQYVQKERQKTLSGRERSSAAVAEHKSIMEAIRDGNAELAQRLANEHVCNAYKNMVKCGLSEDKFESLKNFQTQVGVAGSTNL